MFVWDPQLGVADLRTRFWAAVADQLPASAWYFLVSKQDLRRRVQLQPEREFIPLGLTQRPLAKYSGIDQEGLDAAVMFIERVVIPGVARPL